MDTPPNPNLSPSPKSNIYHISGVPVDFPFKPYGSQLALMSRVISTLDRARRQGHCHALLESPTGTGKTLSLLCSSLAWKQHRRQLNLSGPHSSLPPSLEAADPLLHGGGFIPEPETSGNPDKSQEASNAKALKKHLNPNIYYASRTHSQISQVIREYRRTSYRVPMAVLASRKHYCTNNHVCGKENVDEVCKLLLKDPSGGCPEFKNANKVKGHPSIQIGGSLEVHDIEDLVRIGQHVKGCSYFAAQTLAAEAQIVFCPYSYIINPIVRRAMDVDIKGCILIIDEAHNIEEMAREGGSVDIEEEVLHELQAELGQLCMTDSLVGTYRPLYDVVLEIVGWINSRKDNLQKKDFEHYLSYWTGEKATQELQRSGISQQYFPVLQECAIKAIKAAYDAAPGETHLTGMSLVALEGLFSSLGYFFSRNGYHANDYQLALQRYVKRDGSNTASGWTVSLSLWCLNPAVVFKDIADLSLSVILTSGTLSPLGSFSSELGVLFETCMVAPHVINTESQLWAAVVSSGVGNIQLNASYKTADSYSFQDSLGETLEEICKIVPGGALVFFPSYKLLEKLQARWHQTGQWSKLNAQKEIFIEPRGSTNEFEQVLRGYYDTISGKNKAVLRKIRSGLKLIQKRSSSKGSSQIPNRGAAFLAVCRGKVSEGIDFSDDNARVVVIVGIPFPNKNDTQVMLKKKFNDTYKSSKNLLSGSEWYCHQAFRALNQAAGRCIRHRFDYGAIILLDERYEEHRNLAYISKWLRSSIKSYKSFDDSLEGLQTFFRNIKEQQILEEGNGVIDNSNSKEMLQPFKSSCQMAASRGNQKLKDSNNHIGKLCPDKNQLVKINQFMKISTCLANDSFPEFQLQAPVIKENEGEDNTLSKCYSNDDSERKSLKNLGTQSFSLLSRTELPMAVDDVNDATCETNRVEYNMPVFQNFHHVPDVPSCVTTSSEFASHDAGLITVTPEKLAFSVSSDCKHDPHFDMSVNSYNQKKRRLKELQNTIYPEVGSSNSYFSETTARFALPSSTNIPKNIDRGTEHSFVGYRKVDLESFKLENGCTLSPFSDICEEMELLVCCLSCKNPLGLPENNFLVKSFMSLSSKVYLSYIRRYGTLCSLMPEYLSETPRANIHVLTSDITFINERLFKGRAKNGFSREGIWCEEDGCVFKTVFCPFCTAYDTCIGVHVLATDASNANLLNKVLFYVDCLCVTGESEASSENFLRKCGNLLDECSDQAENEKHTCSVLLQEPVQDPKQKPAAIMKNTVNPHYCPVYNEKYACSVEINKPGYGPKKNLNSIKKNLKTVKENAGNHRPQSADIEKFAYKPQEKPACLEEFPSNAQRVPGQIEKSLYCTQPKASNCVAIGKSKLKLPRRQ